MTGSSDGEHPIAENAVRQKFLHRLRDEVLRAELLQGTPALKSR